MDRLLTIDQLAEMLQVGKKTIYQWKYKGLIPYIKIGGGKFLRFSENDIVDWIGKSKQVDNDNFSDKLFDRLNRQK